MPRVTKVKASRKEYRCSNCGKTIEKGQGRYTWSFRLLPVGSLERNHCETCGYPKASHLTLNETLSSMYAAQEDLIAAIGTDDTEQIKEAVDSAISACEEQIGEIEDKMSNMECANLDQSPSYETLEERKGYIEEWLDSLQQIEEFDADNDNKEEWINEVTSISEELSL